MNGAVNEHFRLSVGRFLVSLEEQASLGKKEWTEFEIKDLMLKSLIDEEVMKDE